MNFPDVLNTFTDPFGIPGIGDFFKEKQQWQNPADAAKPYLDQIPGQAQEYMNPYRQAGLDALPKLQEQFGRLLNSPEFLAQMGSQYEQSPGYQGKLAAGMEAASQAAAQGGYAGTPAHQASAMDYATNLANQDYQQYLSNVMNAYNTGLQGFGGLNTQGYNASSQMLNAIMNQLMSQANLAYAGQENQNQQIDRKNAGLQDMLGAGLSAAMFL